MNDLLIPGKVKATLTRLPLVSMSTNINLLDDRKVPIKVSGNNRLFTRYYRSKKNTDKRKDGI